MGELKCCWSCVVVRNISVKFLGREGKGGWVDGEGVRGVVSAPN